MRRWDLRGYAHRGQGPFEFSPGAVGTKYCGVVTRRYGHHCRLFARQRQIMLVTEVSLVLTAGINMWMKWKSITETEVFGQPRG